jgi:hypothetical protein
MFDDTSAFADRVISVRFKQNFRRDRSKMNVSLAQELLAERSGIFNWSLIGLARLLKNNHVFTDTPDSARDKATFALTGSAILRFADEHLEPCADNWIGATEMRASFAGFAKDHGENLLVPSEQKLIDKLADEIFADDPNVLTRQGIAPGETKRRRGIVGLIRKVQEAPAGPTTESP